jgi:hypothetical protein
MNARTTALAVHCIACARLPPIAGPLPEVALVLYAAAEALDGDTYRRLCLYNAPRAMVLGDLYAYQQFCWHQFGWPFIPAEWWPGDWQP